jgi:hypothetical protein
MPKCKICSTQFAGRSDKKFCSVRCKNYYHVNLRRATDKAVKEIDTILHRNRSILLEIVGENVVQKKIDKLTLEKKKFNFFYKTHQTVDSAGKTYNYVYDLAWMEFSYNTILVVRKK